MAKSKSTTGSKPNRATNNSKEQVETGSAASLTEVSAAAQTVSAAPPEKKPEVEVKRTQESSVAPDAKIASQAKVSAEPKVAAEPKIVSEGRKFEVMKSDSRKNLFPINLEDEIRRRAYELYQQRGSGSGNEAEDWFSAEREIRQRYHQQSA